MLWRTQRRWTGHRAATHPRHKKHNNPLLRIHNAASLLKKAFSFVLTGMALLTLAQKSESHYSGNSQRKVSKVFAKAPWDIHRNHLQ